MFSSAFVCLFAGLSKNYSTDFHRIRWKSGIWATEKTLYFGSYPVHVTLELGLGRAGVMVRWR